MGAESQQQAGHYINQHIQLLNELIDALDQFKRGVEENRGKAPTQDTPVSNAYAMVADFVIEYDRLIQEYMKASQNPGASKKAKDEIEARLKQVYLDISDKVGHTSVKRAADSEALYQFTKGRLSKQLDTTQTRVKSSSPAGSRLRGVLRSLDPRTAVARLKERALQYWQYDAILPKKRSSVSDASAFHQAHYTTNIDRKVDNVNANSENPVSAKAKRYLAEMKSDKENIDPARLTFMNEVLKLIIYDTDTYLNHYERNVYKNRAYDDDIVNLKEKLNTMGMDEETMRETYPDTFVDIVMAHEGLYDRAEVRVEAEKTSGRAQKGARKNLQEKIMGVLKSGALPSEEPNAFNDFIIKSNASAAACDTPEKQFIASHVMACMQIENIAIDPKSDLAWSLGIYKEAVGDLLKIDYNDPEARGKWIEKAQDIQNQFDTLMVLADQVPARLADVAQLLKGMEVVHVIELTLNETLSQDASAPQEAAQQQAEQTITPSEVLERANKVLESIDGLRFEKDTALISPEMKTHIKNFREAINKLKSHPQSQKHADTVIKGYQDICKKAESPSVSKKYKPDIQEKFKTYNSALKATLQRDDVPKLPPPPDKLTALGKLKHEFINQVEKRKKSDGVTADPKRSKPGS